MSCNIAWAVLTDENVKYDLEFARAAAKAAYDLTDGEHPQVIDTYALSLFDGKIGEAIKLQKKALSLARDKRNRAAQSRSPAFRPRLERASKTKLAHRTGLTRGSKRRMTSATRNAAL